MLKGLRRLPDFVRLINELPKLCSRAPMTFLGIKIATGHTATYHFTKEFHKNKSNEQQVLGVYQLDRDLLGIIVTESTEIVKEIVSSPITLQYKTCTVSRDYDITLRSILTVWISLQNTNEDNSSLKTTMDVAVKLSKSIHILSRTLNAAQRLSFLDDVSQLHNSRWARLFAYLTLKKCKAEKSPMSLLFVDGDNLRQYNDELGYEGGNQMIRALGKIIENYIPKDEKVARWLSGDEFMIVMPRKTIKEAIERAQSLRDLVIERTKHWKFPVTVSIGVAGYPEHGDDLDTLVKNVQNANSHAKKMGKNLVSTPPAKF
jgi:diguanylate cyclase (GGDEF)-like protein